MPACCCPAEGKGFAAVYEYSLSPLLGERGAPASAYDPEPADGLL